uniref:Vitamin B12-binding protein n=1 Tax=Candidatus Methanophaga sp. ANME-1 ERB7 TaxID=2759913 RepID=A0A7G9ZAZ7_9EURY|nr:vitamin B12-binding protein [Methanosarcinales archaeon ANME-1 ERB7]
MKNKTLASLEIAIVFCLLFFVALPGIAAAIEDETLDIYGNANEDDIIDMRDLTFTARMILRLEDETELADANYDGRVSVADMTQIGLIILGRESKLTLVDSADRIVTVNKPVERLILLHPAMNEAIISLGAIDKIIAVMDMAGYMTTPHPVIKELPTVGTLGEVDYEKIFELEPDIVMHNCWRDPGEIEEMLEPEITVVRLDLYVQPTYTEEVRKLRYVLNTEEDGEEFIAWYEGMVNEIAEKTAGLSEDEKPQVFRYYGGEYGYGEGPPYGTYGKDNDGGRALFEMTGGINIVGDLPGDWIAVEAEWVLDQNPPVILRQVFDITKFGYEIDDPSEAEAFREDGMSKPGIEDTDAVENEKVYLIQGDLLNTEWFIGVSYVAKWFHPELFSDLNPQAFHQEYLDRFQGLDYDLSEHGVFVVPEP